MRRQSISRFLEGGNIHLVNLEKLLSALGYSLRLGEKSSEKAQTLLKHRFKVNPKKISRFCKRHGIRYLALFGSVLRDDFEKGSDIDVLIDFNEPVTFFELSTVEEKLRKLIGTSHNLDVVTVGSLSPLIADKVINESEVLYDKAA